MNEHDSERIAGLLEADGYSAAAGASTTPTSSCSTPAASARTPTTGSTATSGMLKAVKQQRPGHADRGRRLPGPEGPRPHPRAGAARRRRVRHPQRAPGRRAARRGPRRWPGHRDLGRDRPRRRRRVPFGPAGPARGAVRGVGHDPDRLRQQLRLLHRARRARAARSAGPSTTSSPRSSGPPPTASSRSRCSARTSTATAATSRCRPARRRGRTRAAAAVRRPAAAGRRPSTASGGSATPARTPRTCAPRRSPPWPRRRRVCEHLHLPLQAGSDRVLAAMHRGYTAERYLERLAAARVGGPRPRGHHRHHRRVPGRDRRRLRAHARGRGRGRDTTARTRSCSAPARHGGGRPAPTSSCPPTCAPSASSASESSSSASALARHRGASGGVEEVLVEGPSRKDPAVTTGRTRQNKLVHFRAERPLRPGTFADVLVTGGRAAPPHRRAGGGHRRGPPPHPHPRRRRLTLAQSVMAPRRSASNFAESSSTRFFPFDIGSGTNQLSSAMASGGAAMNWIQSAGLP